MKLDEIKIDIYDPILDALLPYREVEAMDYSTPFVFEFKKNNQGLFYFGGEHSKDFNHPQFTKIISHFKLFISKYPKPDIVAIMENIIPPLASSPKEAVNNYGETGLLRYLAEINNIDYYCPEPKHAQIMKNLQKTGYSREDIALWIFVNSLWYFLGINKMISKNKLLKYLEIFKLIDSSLNFNLLPKVDIKNDSRAQKKFISKINDEYISKFRTRLFELLDDEVIPKNIIEINHSKKLILRLQAIQDPKKENTILNDVGAALIDSRDRYLTAAIVALVKMNKSPFVLFGVNHAVAQQPVYKKIFK